MSSPAVEVIRIEPLAVGPKQAAELLGLSESTFHAHCTAGLIGPQGAKIGKRRLFSVEELRNWIADGMEPRRKWLQRKESSR